MHCKYHEYVFLNTYIIISVSASFFIMMSIRYRYTKNTTDYDFLITDPIIDKF